MDHLSVTQLNMFLRCPKQYEFRYIEGIKIPPSGAMIEGSAYHSTVAGDLNSKLASGKLLQDSEIADIFSDSFEYHIRKGLLLEDEEDYQFEEIDWEERTPGEVKDEGVALAKLYHQKVAGTLNPVEVEQKQFMTVAGIPFVLIADVVESERIIDHKVAKRRQYEDALRTNLQATAYSMFYNRDLEFHYAMKNKTPEIYLSSTHRDESDWTFFMALVEKVVEVINSGIFFPNPTGWWCGEKWCGYWPLCYGKK